jgi:hypothetical protein
VPRLILHDHHKLWIVTAALFSQLPDCVFGIGKCGLNIRQVGANRIILDDPAPSAYREEISLHLTPMIRLIRDPRINSGSSAKLEANRRTGALDFIREDFSDERDRS